MDAMAFKRRNALRNAVDPNSYRGNGERPLHIDAETIRALAEAPVLIVLIYLLIRQQNQIQVLLNEICEIEKAHVEKLYEILRDVGFTNKTK